MGKVNDQFLPQDGRYDDLIVYRKSECICDVTDYFCKHYMDRRTDRTVDQMMQAARSGKQNIVEGSEDGKTSTEMELRLLNVARGSIGELRQDYEDFLKSRHLALWTTGDERYQAMQDFTRQHNQLLDYEPYFQRWTAEEMANVGLTLCYQIDAMMNSYMSALEHTFVTEGGIKERMYQARTGYRREHDARLASLEQELEAARLEIQRWKQAYNDLKERALKAYNQQQEEIVSLKSRLEKE